MTKNQGRRGKASADAARVKAAQDFELPIKEERTGILADQQQLARDPDEENSWKGGLYAGTFRSKRTRQGAV